ncbi:hypothetical protein ACFVTX_10540 [Agromyces sp. NPDC058136]|uniref:hypothetical protein n=1 Tax=Agromyces sp. NPDC058136 TaxID=3346354 RepID=UPI0036DC25C3
MASDASRGVDRTRFGAARRVLVALLGVAAVLVGLLAMHTAGAGAEHSGMPVVAVAAPGTSNAAPAHGEHAASASVSLVETFAALPVVESIAAACDEQCMSGLVDCALMVIGCVMLLLIVAFVLLAGGPAVFRRLLDRVRALVAAFARGIPLHLQRPDLTVLSISRT